jgi:hypothetical protein
VSGLTSEATSELRIDGIRYVVLHQRAFEHKGQQRTEFCLKRPKGRLTYYAVRYENGTLSAAV